MIMARREARQRTFPMGQALVSLLLPENQVGCPVNLTRARVIREEGASIEKMLSQASLLGAFS